MKNCTITDCPREPVKSICFVQGSAEENLLSTYKREELWNWTSFRNWNSQFALIKRMAKRIYDHIALCQNAWLKQQYQLDVFGESNRTKLSLNFDLAVLVLKQIPKTKTSLINFFFFYFLVAVTMGSIGIAGYISGHTFQEILQVFYRLLCILII